jgi:hypothetical protein
LIEDVDLVHFAVADMSKSQDISAQIEQRAHLDCGFGTAKRRPSAAIMTKGMDHE